MEQQRYKKMVWISFFMTLLGVILVVVSYLVKNEEQRVVLGSSGFGLAIASFLLRWTAKLKPEWFDKSSKK